MDAINLVKIEITPEESVPMMGYGDRISWSKGIHDPLYAYILYVKSDVNGPESVWIVTDVCLFSIQTALDLRTKLAESSGISLDEIVISATHTHSGPDVRYLSQLKEAWEHRYYSMLVDRLTKGIIEAKIGAYPGILELRQGSMILGANRRNEKLPIDPRVIMITLLDEEKRARGYMFHYSCHLTALGVDNYLISSDWVGPVRTYFEEKLSVPFGFIQGAEGNIDPVCRGLLHMEDPDQAVGVSFEKMEKTSGIAVKVLNEMLGQDPVSTLSTLKTATFKAVLPLRYGALTKEQAEERIAEWKNKFAEFLGIPESEVPENYHINALVKEKCRKNQDTPEVVLEWVSQQFSYCGFLNIYRNETEYVKPSSGELLSTISYWDFKDLLIVGIPAEPLVENAFHLQEQFPDDIILVGGLANGWFGYLPHADNFKEENQHVLYETISTMVSDKAAEVLIDKVVEMRGC